MLQLSLLLLWDGILRQRWMVIWIDRSLYLFLLGIFQILGTNYIRQRREVIWTYWSPVYSFLLTYILVGYDGEPLARWSSPRLRSSIVWIGWSQFSCWARRLALWAQLSPTFHLAVTISRTNYPFFWLMVSGTWVSRNDPFLSSLWRANLANRDDPILQLFLGIGSGFAHPL